MSKFILFSKLNQKATKRLEHNRAYRWFCVQNKFLNLLLIAVMIGLGVAYLFSVNQTASRGFAVSSLEERLDTLNQENEKLQLQVSESQSLTEVQRASAVLNLVSVDKVEYLKDSAVALGE